MPAVHIPQDAATLPEYRALARRLEAAGYDRLWAGEINDVDAVTAATLAAVGTERITVGMFVNTFTRSPTTLAMTAATLAALAPGRTEVALGVGSPLFVEQWNGIPFRRLHDRLRDVLRFLRLALDGERVREQFDTFECRGFALGSRPEVPPSLLVAACGPRALELAAREADGVVLNWITPDQVDLVDPLPEDRAKVSMTVNVCPTADRGVVDRIMRPVLANYLNVPAYAQQQRRLGGTDVLAPVWAGWAAGDPQAARAALPDHLLDEFVVWGDPAACRDRLREIERDTGARVIAMYFPVPGATFADVTIG